MCKEHCYITANKLACKGRLYNSFLTFSHLWQKWYSTHLIWYRINSAYWAISHTDKQYFFHGYTHSIIKQLVHVLTPVHTRPSRNMLNRNTECCILHGLSSDLIPLALAYAVLLTLNIKLSRLDCWRFDDLSLHFCRFGLIESLLTVSWIMAKIFYGEHAYMK